MNLPKYKTGMMNETRRTTNKKIDSSIKARFLLSLSRSAEKNAWHFFRHGSGCIFREPVRGRDQYISVVV